MPRLPHHGHATVRPDVVDQRLRGLHVEDDLGARVALQEVAGEQDQDEIGLVTAAALVHDAHAIGVAVVGDAEIGADLDDSGLEVHDIRRVLRVGEVMGKAAVRLAVELDDPTPDAAQELRRVEPGDAVARVDDDRETAPEADHPADRGEVVVAGAPRVEGPVALLEVAALGERTEELDLLLRERRRAPVNHLHAVVRDRVVAPRDVGAAVELPVGGGEVEDRRRHDADVHHVDAGGADALDEPRLQRLRRRAVVLPDGDPAPGLSPNQRAVRAADLTEHVGVDVPTDDAAHVVGAEHVRVEHCATLFATLL